MKNKNPPATLTEREFAAIEFVSAILAKEGREAFRWDAGEVARKAVECADALFAATKPPVEPK